MRRPHFFTSVAFLFASFLFAGLFCTLALASQEKQAETENKTENRSMRWDPPKVDGALKPLTLAPPCVLSDVLKQAGGRAKEMEENLSNFTADEMIRYELIGRVEDRSVYRTGTFEYLAVLTRMAWGPSVQETLKPIKGTQLFPGSTRDRGLPGLAFIFLPTVQTDYDMKCEGGSERNGRPAWVVHFQQRPGRQGHLWSYTDDYGVAHVAKVKGRAWVSADSGDVVHLETALMEGVPETDVRDSWFSIDYGPVQFHSQNVSVWLPQAADSYTQFDDLDHHRMIIYHTFGNFMLFSVQVKQEIKNPAPPH